MFAIDMYTKFLDVITLCLFDINGAYKGYVKSVNDANEAERKRVEALTKEIKKQQEVIDKLEGQIKSTEKLLVALKKKEDAIVKAYDKEIELLQAAGKSTEEAEKAKLKAVNDSLNQRIKAQEKHLADTIKIMDAESKQHEAMIERNGKFDKVLVTQFQDLNKNRIKDSKATLEQLKIDKDNSDQAIKVNDAKNQKEANDKWKENEEKRRALELEANKLRIQQENEYLDTIANLQEENFESTLSAQAIEKRAVEAKYFELEEAAKGNAEQLAIVTEAKERELGAITKKYTDEENRLIAEATALRVQKENEYLDTVADLQNQNFESTLTEQERELRAIDEKYFALETAAKGNAEQLAIINEAKNKEISDSNKKYRTEEENQQKQINDFRLKAVQDTLNTLSSLNELFGKKNEANAKKAFQVNKAISIASTLVQTYQSATAAYASQIIPLDPSSVVRGTIAAGLAVAAGLVNVAKIASTQFNGGASASGGASGGGVGSSPSLPSVDTSSTPFQFPTVEGNNPQATSHRLIIQPLTHPQPMRSWFPSLYVVRPSRTLTSHSSGVRSWWGVTACQHLAPPIFLRRRHPTCLLSTPLTTTR